VVDVSAVKAAELQAGDVLHEHDWLLHVGAVECEGACVAFAVTEFPGTLMHRAAGDVLEVTR
jgi:hypothetical protein